MTREQIIESLYMDADINQAIAKMQPVELQEDLRQEMFLVLCEASEEKLLKMYLDGWVKFFLVRTMLNMVKSDRSTFYKKFRQVFTEYTEKNTHYSEINANFDEHINKAANCLHWYEKEILKLYAEKRNIVQISKETKIPYRSLFKTINKAKHKMKQALRKDDTNQTKLIGSVINARIDLTIDIDRDMSNDELVDLLERISFIVNEKISNKKIEDAIIKKVSGIRIKNIL